MIFILGILLHLLPRVVSTSNKNKTQILCMVGDEDMLNEVICVVYTLNKVRHQDKHCPFKRYKVYIAVAII